MPRRGAFITQADIARVLRAYRSEGLKVRVRLMPDGSTAFDPIENADVQLEEALVDEERDVVL